MYREVLLFFRKVHLNLHVFHFNLHVFEFFVNMKLQMVDGYCFWNFLTIWLFALKLSQRLNLFLGYLNSCAYLKHWIGIGLIFQSKCFVNLLSYFYGVFLLLFFIETVCRGNLMNLRSFLYYLWGLILYLLLRLIIKVKFVKVETDFKATAYSCETFLGL